MGKPLIFSVFTFWKNDDGSYRLRNYAVAACSFAEAVAAFHDGVPIALREASPPLLESFITTLDSAERLGSVYVSGTKEDSISAHEVERWKERSLFPDVIDGEKVAPSWVVLPGPSPMPEPLPSLEQRLADSERRLHFIIDQADLEHVGRGVNHWCLSRIVFDAAGQIDLGGQREDICAAIDAATQTHSPSSPSQALEV